MSGRLFSMLASSCWAITEDALQRMAEVYFVALERKSRGEELDREAVEKQLGRKLDNTRTVSVRSGIATIPVEGAIFRRADMFTEMSGGTTVETLAQDFNRAINDSSVSAIVLYIDSPGGEVNGINEFSNHIFDARGQKPIIAYIAHTGASAAYWIATAADEIVTDATAALGSIGVVAAVRDPSKENRRSIEFVSSQSPNKRPDPTTEGGKAQIQQLVDSLGQVFVEQVARNRGVSVEIVTEEFGKGGLLVGQAAVDAGLADRVGSYEAVLSELQNGYMPKKKSDKAPKAGANQEEKIMSNEKSWFQRLFGTMTEDERRAARAELEGERAGEGEGPGEAATQASRHSNLAYTAADREAHEKAAKYDALLKERREEAAKAFAQAAVKEGHILPAAEEQVRAVYLQHAEDDERSPLPAGATRVENYKSFITNLPKHALTAERAQGLPKKVAALPVDESAEDRMKQEAESQVETYVSQTTPKRLKEVKN